MSDTYNYNSGSPFGGLGGLFGGGFGGCNNWMDLIALIVVGGLFGFGGFGGGFGGFGGRAGGQLGADAYAATTAALINQQQTGERVAGIATGVDAVAGLVTAQGNKLETVKDAVVNGFYANQTGLCQSFNNVAQQFNAAAMQAMNNQNATTALLNDMRFESAKCCCDTQRQIEGLNCNLTHRLDQDKCETLRAIQAEGEATRAMMRDIQTQRLQEKLAKAEAQLSQNAQTAAIVSAVQANCSPCAPKCGCGCGNGYAYGFNPAGKCGDLLCSVQNAFADEIAQRIINPTTAATAA